MITNPVNIVGCGTLGSCLAIEIVKQNLISELNIYDFDTIGERPSYPFLKNEYGIPKIKLIEFLCKKHNPNILISTYLQKITEPFDFESFTIDCRDSKHDNINADVKVSLDGHLLYINSIRYTDNNKDYHRYISPRNESYINKSINIIINYLKNNEYESRNLKLYNVINDYCQIIKKE